MGKRADNPRIERFTLVLTDEERRQLEQLAGTKGLSMSEFVRARVFAAARGGDVQCSISSDPKDH